mmetsp:Transcript_8441/g.14525  ORF Transcript_8441/g.14525 Transcript_8441/m.14525 type:complete len:359 (-) Transcript_8441:284-1360(-)|eukprot:CAMPEP_0198206216 /NCGR_PEP_ID=MMETSP1445-20131203/9755_1 /TAXON_ID=36898 /ORGANISM="Pyramimonas sp., Strain CCMP2087" /LENGTH=358 /DNA_ID=CAMNT_0043878827 /DNA_START=101 /DNA_END=1177 /DNA_ORIENTATION=+
MNWFQEVFGFQELPFEETQKQFSVEEGGTVLVSRSNGKRFHVGGFDTPSLAELRNSSAKREPFSAELKGLAFQHIVGDARELHCQPCNLGAVFLVASQFNCLEMVGPDVRPEDGVTRYCNDHTQGPACALACPAGTVFRNYFVNELRGQRAPHQQLDLLAGVGAVLGNNSPKDGRPQIWEMRNGYCFPVTALSMRQVGERLAAEPLTAHAAKAALRVGCHWETEVHDSWPARRSGASCCAGDAGPQPCRSSRVCQVFCSAVPVAYTTRITKSEDWEPLARLILEGAYDATLTIAAIAAKTRQRRVKVYLTALGGGAFGNRSTWIKDAIRAALEGHKDAPLDVFLVHYRQTDVENYKSL